MANLAGDLSRTIFGQSDAVKAFRPWWIVMEDYVMYAMVLMGKSYSCDEIKMQKN